MKKILILMITTVMLFGWEINTHRAIDRSAINESKKDGNLKSFIENSGIDTKYKYLNEKYEGYTKKDGTAFSYFDYIDKGEEGGISDWNQTFAGKDNIQDAIEAGSILEDAQWADHPWFGANGRFLNHFADPQNNYKGFSLGEANALSWATGVARHYPGVNPYLQDSNQYDYLNALEYFKDGFVSKQLDERRRYQAKMLVSVGHILHLMNDMNVPAHTRDDAHPNGDAFSSEGRGGLA